MIALRNIPSKTGCPFANAGFPIFSSRQLMYNINRTSTFVVREYREVDMPNIPLEQLQPTAPLHWISILHYFVLLVALALLLTSTDKTSPLYVLIVGAQAFLTAGSLYVDKIALPDFVVFIIRVGMTVVPILLAGLSHKEQTRSIAIAGAVAAAPVLFMTFFSCTFGGFLADPRIIRIGWCS